MDADGGANLTDRDAGDTVVYLFKRVHGHIPEAAGLIIVMTVSDEYLAVIGCTIIIFQVGYEQINDAGERFSASPADA